MNSIKANLKGLLPTALMTAQVPLRSEGAELADLLRRGGVPVDYRNFDEVTHEFFGMAAVLDSAKEAEDIALRT